MPQQLGWRLLFVLAMVLLGGTLMIMALQRSGRSVIELPPEPYRSIQLPPTLDPRFLARQQHQQQEFARLNQAAGTDQRIQ